MDFLTRFKGRTNLVTKEGMDSLLTETDRPINKKDLMASWDFSASYRKPKNLTPKASSKDFRKSLEKGYSLPEQMSKAKSPDQRLSEKPSNGLKLGIDFARKNTEHAQPYFEPGYLTPQHRKLSFSESLSADRGIFYHKDAQVSHKSRFFAQAETPQLRTSVSTHEQLEWKNTFDNSGGYRLQDNYHGPLVKPRVQYDDSPSSNSQEARLSRLSFVERQEKMLSKYKPK